MIMWQVVGLRITIQRTIFTDNKIQVARERRVKYLGTVKVNIAKIEFEPPLPQDLDLDEGDTRVASTN